ncbi:MAG: hypothetical protein IT381_12350 [Deltaproteobacteria bacterium]|nr:hypothetical protein [Deltaproteobacteria bacterium]
MTVEEWRWIRTDVWGEPWRDISGRVPDLIAQDPTLTPQERADLGEVFGR